jgi:hypothetical protein
MPDAMRRPLDSGPSRAGLAVTARLRLAAATPHEYDEFMCRNIRVLYNFDPPTTDEEIRAAALQYVRKVSGLREPSGRDVEAFASAVDEVSATTSRFLASLHARTAVRTREREREKARARGERRTWKQA